MASKIFIQVYCQFKPLSLLAMSYQSRVNNQKKAVPTLSQFNYWRVGAVKVAAEEGRNLLSSKEITMATKLQPTSRHLSTQHGKGIPEIPVCGIDTYPQVWDGRREKKASKRQCLCRPPWTSPPDPGELAALALAAFHLDSA